MTKRKRTRGSGSKSVLEEKVARDLQALGLMEGCQRQYRFHPTRKWLLDFAWPSLLLDDDRWAGYRLIHPIALEVNGGTYLQGNRRGAHSRPVRQRQDYEKWSMASIMGWTLILVDSVDVRKGVHVERVLRAMGRS